MTPEELTEVIGIKADLDILDVKLDELNTGTVDSTLNGASLGLSTELTDYVAALVIAVTALRDSKQTEFDDFVGTAV